MIGLQLARRPAREWLGHHVEENTSSGEKAALLDADDRSAHAGPDGPAEGVPGYS